jgi:hypothetical protein
MTRTLDSNTEKLNELYKERAFLKTKMELQQETFNRTGADIHVKALGKTGLEIEINQAEIDKLLDKDI